MHWRGEGPFDDELWHELGRRHLDLLRKAAAWAGLSLPIAAIVEWGVGGGMNAVQLCRIADRIYGVDINPDSLEECARQVAAAGCGELLPVLIEADRPEAVRDTITDPCGGFFSSYVFELFPDPDYGLRVMRIAYELLRPGGVAVVQIRYHSGPRARPGTHRAYRSSWVTTTTYAIDEFWKSCSEIGFEPLFVSLVPIQPELNEERYAWFAMTKPAMDMDATAPHRASR